MKIRIVSPAIILLASTLTVAAQAYDHRQIEATGPPIQLVSPQIPIEHRGPNSEPNGPAASLSPVLTNGPRDQLPHTPLTQRGKNHGNT